jgi:hypothetical protein
MNWAGNDPSRSLAGAMYLEHLPDEYDEEEDEWFGGLGFVTLPYGDFVNAYQDQNGNRPLQIAFFPDPLGGTSFYSWMGAGRRYHFRFIVAEDESAIMFQPQLEGVTIGGNTYDVDLHYGFVGVTPGGAYQYHYSGTSYKDIVFTKVVDKSGKVTYEPSNRDPKTIKWKKQTSKMKFEESEFVKLPYNQVSNMKIK